MSKMVGYSHEENVRDATRDGARCSTALDTLPVPLIGRIHGAALGGGAGLAAVCDIVVAAEGRGVRVHRSEARDPAGGDLAVRRAEDRRVGGARAVPDRRALLRRAREEIGLVHAVVAAERARRGGRDVRRRSSQRVAARSRAAKALIPQVLGRPPADVMAHHREAIAEQRVSAEGQEGLRAFLEKRAPAGDAEASPIRASADRQPRRDRGARSPAPAASWASRPSRSTPTPTRSALHVARGRRADRDRPAAGRRELPGHRSDHRGGAGDAAPTRSIPATAFSPSARSSPGV